MKTIKLEVTINDELSNVDEVILLIKHLLIEPGESLKVIDSEAIAEHEQSKWKKYPENKPDKSGWYWVHHKDGYESRVHSEENWELFVESKKVIAFRELPKPYQEGGER